MAMVTAMDRVPMDKVATGRVASAKEAMVSAASTVLQRTRTAGGIKCTDTLQAVGTVVMHIGATWTHFVHEHTYVSE